MKQHTGNFEAVADSCWTCTWEGGPEAQQLMDVTKKNVSTSGIAAAKVGNRIGDIGAAIQEYAEKSLKAYGVVRDLVGHGVGPTMHERSL